ncbi:MAG: hypothetical protein ABIM88_08755 [candidate division WOR-3 bacterium]
MLPFLLFMAYGVPYTDLEFLEQGLMISFDRIPWGSFSDTISIVEEESASPWAWLVGECLTEKARESGKEVFRSGNPGVTIRYRVGDLAVTYSKKRGIFPWSGVTLKRESRHRIYMTAFSGDTVLLWSETLSGRQTQNLEWKWKDAIRVEGLSPDVEAEPNMGLAEPLLTALILGGLLYVFYYFESQ